MQVVKPGQDKFNLSLNIHLKTIDYADSQIKENELMSAKYILDQVRRSLDLSNFQGCC